MRALRVFAWVYAGVVVASLTWAAVTDIAMRNGAIEHMLPSIVFFFVSAPLSVGVGWLVERLPSDLAFSWWVQVLFILCPVIQAVFLFWLSRPTKATNGPS